MGALPRGICSVCGGDVALRKGGLVREHPRWVLGPGYKPQKGAGTGTCPGSGRPAKAPRSSSLVDILDRGAAQVGSGAK